MGREKYGETHSISHKNCDYPKRGLSLYILQTIIHCPTHQRGYKGAHNLSFDTLRQMTMAYISKSKRLRTFDVHRAVHRNIISIVKPTRCTNVSNLFWNDTLHVSDGLSVHHQEFRPVHTATGVCQTDTAVC